MSGDFKEKNSFHGKGFLIAIVIFFSSLSFTLGYFVGKIGREEKPLLQAPAAQAVVREAETPPKAPERAEVAPTEPARPEASREEKTVSSDAAALRSDESGPGPPSPPPVPGRKLPVTKTAPAEVTKRSRVAQTKDETTEAEKPEKKNGPKYTVQIAALKSAPEARKMKVKLAGKGYKPYVSIVKDRKKHETIYKVRAGEFEDRKEAEILALKINKSEHLKSFVTAKD